MYGVLLSTALALMALATSTPAASVAGAPVRTALSSTAEVPRLLLPGTAAPGRAVQVSGVAFSLPAPRVCEVGWVGDRPEVAEQRCGVAADGVHARVVLAQRQRQRQTYTVSVCVPSCADPWAGRAEETLPLEPSEPEPPPSEPGTPLPTRSVPIPGPTTTEPTTTEPTTPAPTTTQPTTSKPIPPAPPLAPPPAPALAPARPVASAPLDGPRIGRGVLRPVALVAAPGDQELSVEPDPQHDGAFDLRARSLPLPASRRCELVLDRVGVQRTCEVDAAGALSGRLDVPSRVEVGTYQVTACRPDCAVSYAVRAKENLVITGPTPSTSPTQPVRVVRVPDLTGLTAARATARLQRSGLWLGATTGAGVVGQQRPSAGERVPVGTPVDVELVPALVQVPELTGWTVAQARELLAPLELSLAGDPDATATIETQEPAAGTQVVPGTLVHVSLTSTGGLPAWLLGLLLAVAALLTGAAASVGRSVLDARSPRLRALPDPAPVTRISVRLPAQRRPALQLLARPDRSPTRTITRLTEARRDDAR